MTNILSTLKQNGLAELNVNNKYEKLLALLNEIEVLFREPMGSNITTELEELDLRRDRAIIGVTTAIKAATYHPDPNIVSHAKLLEYHLSIMGPEVSAETYPEETAIIRKIIRDWKTQPELGTAVNLLGLTAYQTELESANNLFEKRRRDRAEEKGAAPKGTIKAKRVEANDAYYAIRDHLNANFFVNEGAGPFGKTVRTINKCIEDYNELLVRRKKDD